FISSKQVVCRTTCISFADQSANNPTSWHWFFNGGTPSQSTSQNPLTVCYNIAGDYDVRLIVSNPYGSDTLTMANFIHVVDTCPRPIANFAASDTLPFCSRTCLHFSDSTQNVDPTTTWEWHFPGAYPDSSDFPNPDSICYNDDGVFDVML